MHISRQGVKGPYTEVIFGRELIKYGLSEWNQQLSLAEKQKGKYSQELNVALDRLIKRVMKLKMAKSNYSKQASSSAQLTGTRKKKDNKTYLLPYDTRCINNTLPQGVEPVQHKCILVPENGIFYQDAQGNMCFQRTIKIPNSPTEHLFHLRLECMGHKELELGFHALISIALAERTQELRHEDYIWIKPEIEEEAEVFQSLII